jgi:hypothetical protein
MIAVAGLVHSKGLGFKFHDRTNAFRFFGRARLESRLVTPSDCLPRIPKKPST